MPLSAGPCPSKSIGFLQISTSAAGGAAQDGNALTCGHSRWARSLRCSRPAMLVETTFAALLWPQRLAALSPHSGGVHWPNHQLLQWNKLDLARAQLFLEGKRRGALLLLISQRLSAGIILRWLCGYRTTGQEGADASGAVSLTPGLCCGGWCISAAARSGGGKKSQCEACAGGRRRESRGRRVLLSTTGTRPPRLLWHLSPAARLHPAFPAPWHRGRTISGRADTAAPAPGPLSVGLIRGGSTGARQPAAALEPGLGAAAAQALPFCPDTADGSPSTQPSRAASPIFFPCHFSNQDRSHHREGRGMERSRTDGRQKTSPVMRSSSW